MRTTFSSSETGKPKIKVNDTNSLDLQIIDLQNTPQPEKEVKRISQAIAQEPFNLDREIPIRLTVVKLSSTESTVIIVLHHIIADGWSREILLKEFSLLYKSISNNSPYPLDAIEIQYRDFAAWEKQWLAGKEHQVQLDYWKKQLANLSVLNLPTDLPRPSILNSEWLQLALQHLVSHHDALRMKFEWDDSGWMQFNLETVEDPELIVIDRSEFENNYLSQSGQTHSPYRGKVPSGRWGVSPVRRKAQTKGYARM